MTNFGNSPLGNFQTKFNNNSYCLKPSNVNIDYVDVLNPGETKIGEVILDLNGNPSGENPTSPIQVEIALGTSNGIWKCFIPVYFNVFLRFPSEYNL